LNTSLVNNGSAIMANNGAFIFGNNATLTNATGASLLMEWGITPQGSGSIVNQAGATILVAPTPTQNYVDVEVPFTNAGLVHVEAGVPLTLGNGSANSSSYLVDAGSTLVLGGTQTLTSTSSISGAGAVTFDRAAATVAGSYAIHSTTVVR